MYRQVVALMIVCFCRIAIWKWWNTKEFFQYLDGILIDKSVF